MKPILTAAAVMFSFSLAGFADHHKAPKQLSTTQMTEVKNIMQTIEQRADSFETEFLKGLDSSTVKVEDREKYRVWVDHLEDQLDNMAEAYKEGDVAQAHEELMEAMNVAKNINHFMLNSDWGSEAESVWNGIRGDLNKIAGHHSAPTSVLIVASR